MGKQYSHLSCEERTFLQLALEQGASMGSIARSLDRPVCTISRELNRNGWSNQACRPKQRGRPPLAGGYRAVSAQQRAHGLASKARKAKRLVVGGELWNCVEILLRDYHSPEQISGILKRMNPEDRALHISHETIYTAIYAMPRGELRKELVACLRQSRKNRRPRARGEDRRGKIQNMISIHDRPPEVDERLVPGHWEGDLIKGARNASAVGTLVERTSLFVTLAKMDNASADAAEKGFGFVLNRIDAQRRLSMTYDQGREMACHERLAQQTGIKVYFADPHSPWQRGINENTNGLLRQFLPKGTDLSVFTQEELDQIAWKLNTRPRKSMKWRCPAEILMPESFDFKKHFSHVALRT
jgi:IS30 family transposase